MVVGTAPARSGVDFRPDDSATGYGIDINSHIYSRQSIFIIDSLAILPWVSGGEGISRAVNPAPSGIPLHTRRQSVAADLLTVLVIPDRSCHSGP